MVKNYNIVGQDLDINSSDRYNLSILVGMDRFFYVVQSGHQVIAMRTHYFPSHNYLQLNAALSGTVQFDQLLKLTYQKTRIGLLSSTTTLIPADLYDASKMRFYLEQNAMLKKEHIVLADELESVGAHQVYAFDERVFDVLKGHFPMAGFCHVLSGLISAHRRYGETENIYVNLSSQYLQIIVFNREKLLFSNTFIHRAESDVLYFIMLVINQLNLDAEKNKVIFSGEIDEHSTTYSTLQKYIQHIEFVHTPILYKYNHATPPAYHHFFDLMCISRLG